MKRTVSKLIIYPIKGFPGIHQDNALCTSRGLHNDRRYMVVKPDGTFYSQRTNPEMTQYQITILNKTIRLSKEDNTIDIKIGEHSNIEVPTKVWSHEVKGYEVSREANEWFSQALNSPARLVYMSDEIIRYKELVVPPQKTLVSYADGYPLLILGTASVEALDSKLDETISYHRFRPNIVIKTEEAHEEDSFDIFNCGEVSLRVNSACARCPVVNINQETGISNKSVLKKLSTYRKSNNKVLFGANTILFGDEGIIRVGDQITI